MKSGEYENWDDLVASILNESAVGGDTVSVERQKLQALANDMSRIVYATERRFQDTADRLVFEHRERFRQDLIDMNNIRIRLNSLLRDSR